MTNQKIKTAILISGRGSNMQALIKAAKKEDFPADIALIISNKENAAGLQIAKQEGIETAIINHSDFKNREDFDKKMAEIIDENNCKVICLAGFMRLLSGWFVNKYQSRLINIHPSLLPAFKGANAVKDALNYGVKISGCTTHFVSEEMDSGEIIMQKAVEVFENDDEIKLAARILQQEHLIYPKSLEIICNRLIK